MWFPSSRLAASQAGAEFYRDRLGFEITLPESVSGVVGRGTVEIRSWGPSGNEPADSDTMLRVEVEDLEVLYRDCRRREPIHPSVPLHDEPWGSREFAILISTAT